MKTAIKNTANLRIMMLAAGEGTRMRPLTYFSPKPLNPILNKPVMEHTLVNLAKQGIKEVMINISYFPEKIKQYFGDGKKYGLKISYSLEHKALGTAGGVKNVEQFFAKNTFVIVSGDGLSDINLTRVVDFHKKKKALGTMVLSKVDSKYEYGVVIKNSDGKITRFLEKPRWSDILPGEVNTGIYVFEPEIFKYIPKDTFYDFGLQVWPRLLKIKKKIYAYNSDEYWCDIGGLDVYRQAHWDGMDKRLSLDIEGTSISEGVVAGEKLIKAHDVKLQSPCVIGKNCVFKSGSVIGPYASLGDNVTVGANSSVQNSVLWNNISIPENTTLIDTIVTDDIEISGINLYLKNAIVTKNIY
ncbi:MAG: NDP-sugar synthase [bacterium]